MYKRQDGEGAARAMVFAMDEAEITPDKVDYINAHGTSERPRLSVFRSNDHMYAQIIDEMCIRDRYERNG